MKKLSLVALAALLLIGGGCTSQTPANQAPTNATVAGASTEAELKVVLEKSYDDAHAALVEKNFKKFIASFSKHDDRLTEKLFLDSQEILNKVFKRLDKSKFIAAYRKGDKAYMIRETYLDDPNFISIDGQIYDYKDGKWLIGEFSTSDSVSKDKAHPENDAPAVKKAIESIKADLENFKPGDR